MKDFRYARLAFVSYWCSITGVASGERGDRRPRVPFELQNAHELSRGRGTEPGRAAMGDGSTRCRRSAEDRGSTGQPGNAGESRTVCGVVWAMDPPPGGRHRLRGRP